MTRLPEECISPLPHDGSFTFRCHPGISCFTECCRELELQLSPYDELRLCRGLGITTGEFLDRYGIIEFAPDDAHPKLYLTMVDDGRATCPFVSANGCAVYDDRPAACRTYPVGRGVYRNEDGCGEEVYVLITEPHCKGFNENQPHTLDSWRENQGIAIYNEINDLLLPLVQHPFFRHGGRLDDDRARLFARALFDLDDFRRQLPFAAADDEPSEALLPKVIEWLETELFP